MDDLQKQLEAVFNSDAYKKVAEAIKNEYMLSDALLGEDQLPREKDWTPVKEPVQVNGKSWKLFIFRYATATEALGKPVYLTFVRVEPPESMKLAIQSLSKDDIAWQKAIEEYGAAVTSDDMNKVKVDLMQFFETNMYPDKEFHFVPDPQAYGLLPHFDFDLVIPFIGLPSLIANSK